MTLVAAKGFTHKMGSETIASPPPGRARVIISVLIVTHLLWQVVVPISYYLGDDPSDERFSWRMFSAIWQFHKTCTASVMEIESVLVPSATNAPSIRKVDLDRTLHLAWITLLKRNRRLVVDKFLQTRCQSDPSVTEIRYSRTCPGVAESRIPSVKLRFTCGLSAFAESSGMP